MTWNLSLISIVDVPIFGPETTDADGTVHKPILGYEPGFHAIIPSYLVGPVILPFTRPVPEGVPAFAGQDCVLVTAPSAAAVQTRVANLTYTDKQKLISANLWIED